MADANKSYGLASDSQVMYIEVLYHLNASGGRIDTICTTSIALPIYIRGEWGMISVYVVSTGSVDLSVCL